jgi:two-component system, OmpR family, sensor histidine kinase TctE
MNEGSSIRRRLAFPIVAALVAFFILDSFASYRNTLASINTAYDRTLLASARAIGETIKFDADKLSVGLSYAALEVFEADTRSRMVYRVTDANGRFLAGYEGLPAYSGTIPERTAYAALVSFYEDSFNNEAVRVAALLQPVSTGGVYEMVTIQVAETLELRRTLAQQTLYGSAIRLGVLVLVLGAIVWTLVTRGLRPLSVLRSTLLQRAPDDLAPLSTRTSSELAPVVDALNEVMARLRRVLGNQQKFVRDASHQLRTPLAVLKVQVQNAKRGDMAPEEAFHTIDESVDRATRVANQMLSLAKVAQFGETKFADDARCDLVLIARDIAVECSPLISQKKLDFALDVQEGATLEEPGHDWMVRELLRNLLGNAIHYTPSGGTLGIAIEATMSTRKLHVWDSGPGVSMKQQTVLFQPFSTGDPVHGSGLGLLICRDICRSFGATLDIQNRHDSNWFDGRHSDATGVIATVTFSASSRLSV